MFFGLYDAIVDAISSAIDGVEALITRLINPRAHKWIEVNRRAVGLHEQHLHDEAGPVYEEALRLARASRRSLRVAITLVNMALLEMEQRRLDDARQHLVEALAIRSRELGEDSRTTASTRRWLAAVYFELDQPAQAAELLAVSLQRAEERFGQESGEVAAASVALAAAQVKAGDLAEAERLYRTTAGMVERAAGPRAPVTAFYLLRLGEFLVARERMVEAQPVLARAVEVWDMVGDEEALTPAVDLLVTVCRSTDDQEAAVAAADRFARNVARFHERDRARVAAALERRSEILRWAGQVDEADKLTRRAAILRAAWEKERLEDQRQEERRREATRPVVDTVDEVLAEAKLEKG